MQLSIFVIAYVLVLLRQIYRWWRPHPRHWFSKARAHRSSQRNLPRRWVETMTSPAILSDPFRAGSGDGAACGHQPKSDKVELVLIAALKATSCGVALCGTPPRVPR